MENSVIRLGLAVWPTDDYTGRPPIGAVTVTMAAKAAIRNPSGYYLFLDTLAGDHQVVIESQYYLRQDVAVTLPLAGDPLVSITLKPLPGYPFSSSATLLRGMVKDAGDKPISGANVAITALGIENQTSDEGEFVLYFKALTEQDIVIFNKRRFVRNNGGRSLQLKVTHPDYKKKTVSTEVEEGKTTSVAVILKKGG